MKKANNIQKSALKPRAARGQCDMLISLVLMSFSLFSTLVFSFALSICVGFFSLSLKNFYNIVLVSTIQQCKPTIITCILPPHTHPSPPLHLYVQPPFPPPIPPL